MDIFSVFTLLGGLAFFIFGMNQLSHSLERIAGSRMEKNINRWTRNRLAGLLLGCVITVAIQSSSAVTVLEANSDQYDPHEYLKQIKTTDNPQFQKLFTSYRNKYGEILS